MTHHNRLTSRASQLDLFDVKLEKQRERNVAVSSLLGSASRAPPSQDSLKDPTQRCPTDVKALRALEVMKSCHDFDSILSDELLRQFGSITIFCTSMFCMLLRSSNVPTTASLEVSVSLLMPST
ncbi:hypothetical protein B296_00028190 [Ensete ventricosum]|uniref:Uncharacterized protein n=1 Tax=Ensete ventricosum TaxID=4639 RepID=A0A426ZA04_ENSVE|nr:hypothetical protein B296_00028190 [Ensete ventricosum]